MWLYSRCLLVLRRMAAYCPLSFGLGLRLGGCRLGLFVFPVVILGILVDLADARSTCHLSSAGFSVRSLFGKMRWRLAAAELPSRLLGLPAVAVIGWVYLCLFPSADFGQSRLLYLIGMAGNSSATRACFDVTGFYGFFVDVCKIFLTRHLRRLGFGRKIYSFVLGSLRRGWGTCRDINPAG